MVAQIVELVGRRFVIVEESEFERMRELANDSASREGPPLPKPDAQGNVPAVEYARASLARKLIRARRAAGLTQAELSRRCGLRVETLCRIEKGKMNPSVATVEKIDRALSKA